MDFKDIFKKKTKPAGAQRGKSFPSDSAETSRAKPVKKPEIIKAEMSDKELKAVQTDKSAQGVGVVELDKEKLVKSAKGVRKKTPKIAPRVLVFPRITEKAMSLAEQGQYVFKVFKNANKIEVKKAVNETYGVAVEKIRIVNIPRKQRRLGKIEGWKQGYKKAIITVKKGQKIDIA